MSGSVAARRHLRTRRPILSILCCIAAIGLQMSPAAARVITRVDIRPGDRETVIAIFTSERQPLEVRSFSLDDPVRLVFDLLGARLDPDLPSAVPIAASSLHQIRLGQFSADPDIARVVVDLPEESAPPEWEVTLGSEPGETLIVLRDSGPTLLGAPSLETVEGAILLRIPGAGDLSRSVATLREPPRIYADLTHAVVEHAYQHAFAEGAVREVRMAQQPADPEHPVARIVIELREEYAHAVFSDGEELVLAVAPHTWELPLPAYVAHNRLQGKRIVVDPGHGGEATGAPAFFGPPPEGPFEKDIVLDIGHRLARVLRAEGAAVTMTREDDTYVSLKDRATIANQLRADAFVSVHCNSCDAPNSLHGTSVYYDHDHSLLFAKLVQQELLAALGTEDKSVRNANFAVIRRTKGPGVLVETAYINHEGDRARLIHPNFRERAARAIASGTIRFLCEHSRRSRRG